MNRILLTAAQRDGFIADLKAAKLPVTVSMVRGKKRSLEQNKLQRQWMNEAAEQLGEYNAEGYRAFCKLHFGVPILRGENPEFCAAYDKYIKPLPYEHKLAMMREPLDFPVSRLMTTGQAKRYLDDVFHHLRDECGAKLTEPDEHEEAA